MKLPIVLFDLDGTLSDSQVGIVASYRHALATLGLEVDEGTVRQWIGPGLRQVMRALGVPEERLEQAVTAYRAHHSTGGIYQCQLYEGVHEMLGTLEGAGALLGVATSKPTPLAEEVLRYLGVASYFGVVAGATFDDARVTKAAVVAHALERLGCPSSENVGLVGDRKYDMQGAWENGVHPIGAAWGYGTVEELLSSGAEAVATSPADVGRLVLAG
jgi:phosphoglycolate phosphatase